MLGVLLHNLSGSAVADDEGRFSRDAFGSEDPVLREDLTLRLDPLQPLRGGSYRFTAEGVPSGRITYLDRGRLRSPVLNRKYARRLGLAPTPIPFGMDALHFEGRAPLDREAALAEAAGGALILSVLGVHTQDFASGDFSLSAPQALALDGSPGGYAGRLRCTISGNLFELLNDERTAFVDFPDEHVPGLLVHARLDPK